MHREIEFFFDCSSPWTYLAFHNVQPLAKELDAVIRWRPILVGGVFNAVNQGVYESRANPVHAKQSYMIKSLHDWADQSGLSLKFPGNCVFPVNSVKVMRGCLLLEESGRLPAFARAAFEAYWRDDLDISQDEVVIEICRRSAVSDPQQFLRDIQQQNLKDRLRANTDELVARGGFGSPTMFLPGGDMYFGNDHLPTLRSALQQI